MCKVLGDKRGASNIGDLIERDPIKGGAEQCSSMVTTSDEFNRKGSEGRLGPDSDEEKHGCPKVTRSSCGSLE